MTDQWPRVTAILPTHDRPAMMRRALASIVAQDYPGELDVVVVFDRAEPDHDLAGLDGHRPVQVVTNTRVPGLAGARNSGILIAQGTFVAFCDDDDAWEPEKLRLQIEALDRHPDAEFISTAMVVEYGDATTARLAGKDLITHADLVRSRMAMLHSSSFLIRRAALLGSLGLIEEALPQSMNEDWDILLRASRRMPVVHVDQPLVRITWGPSSHFAQRWAVRNESQLWLLEHHPELAADPMAAGHAYGKLAFGCAALGSRQEALRWVRRSLRANWREPRAYISLLVIMRVVRWTTVVRKLNERGHGI